MKEIKDANQCKDILYSWTGRLSIVEMSILLKLIHRFNVIPGIFMQSKSQQYFVDIYVVILKFIWKSKETRVAKTILKNNKVGEISLSNFKMLNSYSNQDCVVLEEGHTAEYNKMENPQ